MFATRIDRRAAFLLSGLFLACSVALPAAALEHIKLRHEGKEVSASGRVLVEAQDGGVLLEAVDGMYWLAPSEALIERTSDDAPFEPLAPEDVGQRLLAELPPGFDVYTTRHYVIVYNTTRPYAQWCGSLFERLYGAFTNFWSRKGLKLHEPEFPLVAVVFADRQSYQAHAKAELGEGAQGVVGYYSMRTNRITMYDLTGVEAFGGLAARGRATSAQINLMLAQPGAENAVSTIVHEATHQIAYNCGVHQRMADIPLWVSEGLATYFEAPDLRSAKGWRSIGVVNTDRLKRFQQYVQRRGAMSLPTLLATDDRFRDGRTALDAYAEAWAINYYLLRKRPQQYVKYLETLAEKEPLATETPDERLEEFKAAFGTDLSQFDAEFLRFMSRGR